MGNEESRERREHEETEEIEENKEKIENERNDVEMKSEPKPRRERFKHEFMDENLAANKTIHINGARHDRLFKYFLRNNHNVSEKLFATIWCPFIELCRPKLCSLTSVFLFNFSFLQFINYLAGLVEYNRFEQDAPNALEYVIQLNMNTIEWLDICWKSVCSKSTKAFTKCGP